VPYDTITIPHRSTRLFTQNLTNQKGCLGFGVWDGLVLFGSVPFRNVTNNLFNTLYVRFNKRLNQSGKLQTNPKTACRPKCDRTGGALIDIQF